MWQTRPVKDAELPTERLNDVINRIDAQAVAVIGFSADSGLEGSLVQVSEFLTAGASMPPVISYRSPGGSIAYIIHTSGSTGAPKGVEITHESLLAYFDAHNAMLRISPGAKVMSLAPFRFDASIGDAGLTPSGRQFALT